MDSGNSGSIQSSSGGDEDYDSRAADDSSFNNPSSTTTTTNPLLFSHSSTMFDPLSNYFNPPILTQSDQTNQTLMNTNMPTWSSKPQPNPFFTPMAYTQHSQTIGGTTTTTTSATTATTTTTPGNNNQDQSSQSAVVSGARNPKKRSRASRRAPTTVLTTDTSNFRAMVQEFTGIPSPPFTSSSSPFPRTRLDLFTSPTLSSSFRSPPSTFHHNLLRPFPHKIQPQLSTFTNNNHNINTISTAAAAAAATSTTSPSAILKQPPQRSCNDNYILNNMQIQNLAFESFLPQPSSNDHDQDFGLPSHTQVNTNLLQNISNKNNNGSDLNYAASASSNLNFLGEKELVADDHHHHNVSAASASTTRGEGLMESWICSSD